jgi:hypothetical protein
MDKSTLVALIEVGRTRLDDTLAGFDDAAMADRIDRVWTRQDVLAHLEAWERRVVELLESLRAGADPGEPVDTDELNQRLHARDRWRTWPDVRAGERDAYDRMLAAIRDATAEELFEGSHFAWTEGESFSSWFRENGDEHFAEHLEQLTRPAR